MVTEEDEKNKIFRRQQSMQRSSRTVPLPSQLMKESKGSLPKRPSANHSAKAAGKRIVIDES
ncbi:hypothetical protein ACTGJ3_10955 (plasmid) [Streptococcus suis]|uniref:hypothetical protein n=1 Tax=Streptococcus suis TaxID=1307 RepID=UPI00403C90ED